MSTFLKRQRVQQIRQEVIKSTDKNAKKRKVISKTIAKRLKAQKLIRYR